MKRGYLFIGCMTAALGSATVAHAAATSSQDILQIVPVGQATSTPATCEVQQTTHIVPYVPSVEMCDGMLVKADDDAAIYYIGADKQRHVFPSEKVFQTWYADFSQVQTVTRQDLDSVPMGAAVTYRPGSRLVKFSNSSKVYLVTRGGVLRWAISPTIVRAWYGPLWQKMVDDLPKEFAKQYSIGPAVRTPTEVDLLDVVASTGNSIDTNLNLTK